MSHLDLTHWATRLAPTLTTPWRHVDYVATIASSLRGVPAWDSLGVGLAGIRSDGPEGSALRVSYRIVRVMIIHLLQRHGDAKRDPRLIERSMHAVESILTDWVPPECAQSRDRVRFADGAIDAVTRDEILVGVQRFEVRVPFVPIIP